MLCKQRILLSIEENGCNIWIRLRFHQIASRKLTRDKTFIGLVKSIETVDRY